MMGAVAIEHEAEFRRIASVAREEAGLVISAEKAPMVFARLSKRLRTLGLKSITDYCDLLDGPDSREERRSLISRLTTNVTGFFRESHHFDTLKNDLLPGMLDRAKRGESVRIWSAGCSSGQEPYSIAMTILNAVPDAARLDLRILATDIDQDIIAAARRGIYDESLLEPLPKGFQQKFFQKPNVPGSERDFEVAPALRELVSFRELNLLGKWPMKRKFDVIFCRNVVIYFDQDTQRMLWKRFADSCNPGAYLFLGHSERMPQESEIRYKTVGTTTYCLDASSVSNSSSKKG